jgi:hypothetical protein
MTDPYWFFSPSDDQNSCQHCKEFNVDLYLIFCTSGLGAVCWDCIKNKGWTGDVITIRTSILHIERGSVVFHNSKHGSTLTCDRCNWSQVYKYDHPQDPSVFHCPECKGEALYQVVGIPKSGDSIYDAVTTLDKANVLCRELFITKPEYEWTTQLEAPSINLN